MNRNFNEWLSKFKTSISDYSYYVDFEKIYKNIDKVKVELNILNSLIGSKNIEEEFQSILIKYPDTLECIPLLLAVRSHEIFIKDEMNEYLFKFDKMVYSIEDYIRFMRQSGLFDLLQNHIINNLYDYVLGVEVGLDSNGRKNRGGHLMENLVEDFIRKAGFIKNETYFKELNTKQIYEKWNIDIREAVKKSGSKEKKALKRFDFVIYKNETLYVIETNFYAAQGSKLNETARSYKNLAIELSKEKNVRFIWVTDGMGWKHASDNLEETFNELETIYNINDLENGIFKTLK